MNPLIREPNVAAWFHDRGVNPATVEWWRAEWIATGPPTVHYGTEHGRHTLGVDVDEFTALAHAADLDARGRG